MARTARAAQRARGFVAACPISSALPAITGTLTVGQTLTVSNGSWTNSPTSYSRQWLRDGAPIAGAIGATYVLAGADSGHAISAQVTATNANGPGQTVTTAATTAIP